MKEKINGSQALLSSLMEEGVDTIFGYPGGAIMPVYDALFKNKDKITHYLTRHEQGAVHAAQGYARATGKVGVCFATSGPGATNLMTGIADAMVDSTPLVCITAQVGAALLGSDAFQEADIVNMTLPITKWNYQITKPEEIAPAIAKAFYIASTGRPGPVVLDFAKNAQVGMCDFVYERCTKIRSYHPCPAIDMEDIQSATTMINQSERPIIVFGHGVKIAGAEKLISDLAAAGNIPMASTLLGLSAVPSSDPRYIGMLGMHGNLAPNKLLQEADLMIAVGMRFSDRNTGDVNDFAKKARIIHIDIDEVEINKIIKADCPIVADAAQALGLIIPGVKYKERKEWFDKADEYYDEEFSKVIKNDIYPESETISMGEVIRRIDDVSGDNALVVTDVGQQQMIAARYARYRNTRSLITSGGLGTMGFGLPAAVGAKVGCPDRQVVAILGDGGFQMTMQELGTMMHWGIGVKVVVLNNSFLGMVRQWQALFFEHRYSFTEMVNPDFVQIASAYGFKAKRVEQRKDLDAAIADMLADDKPYFLEVVVGKEDNVFPMVPTGASIDNVLFG